MRPISAPALFTAPLMALWLLALPPGAAQAQADTLALRPVAVTDWKAVYGRIEARDRVPARARIGGTLVTLEVTEGDSVTAGQVLARVVDEKLDFQIGAIDGQLQALESQLANAQTELRRGEELLARGVTTAQRLDALRTQVDVLTNQIAATGANRLVVRQQAAEGAVLAPAAGRVLRVPVTAGAVVMPGEAVAEIGGGGFFLRLAVPERHARSLQTGDAIRIEAGSAAEGTLARIYPQIENGRVIADVEVEDLPDDFVDARVLVHLPVGQRMALVVPQSAITTRGGLDFVTVETAGARVARVVVPGAVSQTAEGAMVEILTGLAAGDLVVTRHD